ncbi:MAG TPA: ChbG/HpnK family deacetylase [Anaerolineales bacterium]|nr:ChbG/HpnK family deacetylase [Anaerolineales bacterium]
MNPPSLIINADDFGWTDGHNRAVEQAHREGILNSASLMTTTSGFAEALQILARSPELRVGVHLTLNETPPALSSAQLPALTGSDGQFHDSIRAIVQLWGAGKLRKEIILAEWRAQLELALRAGVPVSRLDSHKHVHLFPPLWDAFLVLAQEYKIPYIRLPLERFSSLAVRRLPFWGAMWMFGLRARSQLRGTRLAYAARFWGFTVSGAFTRPRLEFALAHPAAQGITEIMVHPACITPQVDVLRKKYVWAAEYLFEEELSALIALKKGE